MDRSDDSRNIVPNTHTMEEQLALAPSAMDDYLFDLKGFLVVRLTGGAFGSPHVARPNRTAHVEWRCWPADWLLPACLSGSGAQRALRR
jgi:hypothetical protein